MIFILAGLAAAEPAAAQSGALVRQDFSDCGNNDVNGSDPSRVGGTVTIAQTAAGATTATVQITRGTPNTTYNFYWKCQRGLGSVQTDANGAGTGSFAFQATAGQVLTFDMYPDGAPSGNKYQSVRITPVAPVVSTQRKSITELTAEELASLRRAVAQMKAWNSEPRNSANFRRSWTYWANMHSFFGQGCANAAGLNNQGMGGLSAQQETTPDEQATWCECKHGSPQFLTWHRMYLYYLEEVLQAASGDPNLRLPYWDYETNGQIPPAFRDPTYVNESGQTVPNPLYIAQRQANLNAGTASLDPAVVSTSQAMQQTTYGLFNSRIENTPHGAVHCATAVQSCPTGYLGAVPAAANDPIFYTHHGNIDRLYECWLQVSPSTRLPSDASILNAQFTFIDGSGNLVTRKVEDMLTTAQLGYSYSAGGGCPPPTQTRRAPPSTQAVRPVRTFQVQGVTMLNRGTTVVPLRLTPELRAMAIAPSAAQSNVVIDGLAFDEIPQVLYKVYLQGPDGRRSLVGVINFFNRTSPHADHDGSATEQVTFDATQALREIGRSRGDASLVIEPATGLADSSPEAAARQISPRANVRLRSVQIHVAR